MIQFTGLEEAKHSKNHQKVCLYTIFTLVWYYVLFFFLNSCASVFRFRIRWFPHSRAATGSEAAGGCQTKKRREQLMSLGISGLSTSRIFSCLVPQLVFFSGKIGTIQSLYNQVNLHREVLHISYIFSRILVVSHDALQRCFALFTTQVFGQKWCKAAMQQEKRLAMRLHVLFC